MTPGSLRGALSCLCHVESLETRSVAEVGFEMHVPHVFMMLAPNTA